MEDRPLPKNEAPPALCKDEAWLSRGPDIYRNLFEKMTEGVALNEMVYDQAGNPVDYRFIDVNPGYERYTGLKRCDIVGKLRSQILPVNPSSFQHYVRTVRTGKPDHFENYTRPLNKYNEIHVYRTGPDQFVTIFTDITERKLAESQRTQAQAELQRHALKLERVVSELKNLQLAVENASDIIFIADPRGTILSVNKAAENLLGYKIGDIVGSNISRFGSPVDPDFYKKMWREIKKGKKIFSGEVVNTSKENRKMVFDMQTSAVTDRSGRVIFFIGIMRDRTEAKAIDRAKTEFISLVAHQLRTPLATMTMAAEMILNGNIGQVDAAAKEQLKNIYDSAYNMANLIELFLNLSRIELGRLQINPEPQKIDDIAQDLVKEIQPQAEAKKIVLQTEFAANLPLVNVDRRVMHIALENLLTNAVKYTPEGGRIVFSIHNDGDQIVSSVADNGLGIPKSQQPLIFTKMFRADNVGDAKGMGLGLNMAKTIIEQSGGSIWVESEENKGSKFSIAIPLSGMKKRAIRMES
jgi:PAS domain S-box-containing protein